MSRVRRQQADKWWPVTMASTASHWSSSNSFRKKQRHGKEKPAVPPQWEIDDRITRSDQGLGLRFRVAV